MSSTTPISMRAPFEFWVGYGGLLWLCENATTCPVYLELCRRHEEDVHIDAVTKDCKDAQSASGIAWITVARSIRNENDTSKAVQAANVAQARYDELSEHRAQVKAEIAIRQEKWLEENPVVRRFI
ncbi:hypothetical protein MMC27_004818 [Xylographa pallens]|nr:hypothetical protein [Xylographa pallens]